MLLLWMSAERVHHQFCIRSLRTQPASWRLLADMTHSASDELWLSRREDCSSKRGTVGQPVYGWFRQTGSRLSTPTQALSMFMATSKRHAIRKETGPKRTSGPGSQTGRFTKPFGQWLTSQPRSGASTGNRSHSRCSTNICAPTYWPIAGSLSVSNMRKALSASTEGIVRP